ncbi:transglycosylase domain-containing protein [Rudaeicoccus suwonensis]|uniref:Membrane peptidoglycan carboxypeptidase n=1 Tax=Rudaeicoccus suwonensis TaxID=657409 RepID=A0A561E352_9MICO|nr:transglycosylase domain-containing protein [Rudaeicoccus suwonensis]TWE10027.1 membrane peptidoglycan carboxypeptidase [Rudaeicoccus suwonensis]
MRHASRLGSVLSLLGAFVASAVAMGLVAAGLLIPAIGSAGAASNGSIKMFNQMPGTFQMNPLAQQSTILASDGSVIATPFNQNRIVVPFNQISQYMKNAQVAIEDARFYQHGAIDTRGIARAITSNIFSNGTQGASTLTQQYVKVALQNQALSAGNTAEAQDQVTQSGMQGYVRKLQQLKYAVTLEQHYSKDEILDGYLNLVYYGDQAYGVEAAAEHYFGVHASQLNLPEAALLAGVVNQPGTLDPVTNLSGATARRNVVLTKMYQQKMISYTQMVNAQKSPVKLNLTNISNSCANSKYPYFCYYVEAWLLQQPALGSTPKARLAELQTGGLTIKTAFNPNIANDINKQIEAKIPVNNSANVQSAAIAIQPGTGLVLGSGQNTNYSNTNGPGNSAINLTTPIDMNGSQGFDFGSAAKLFAVVTALEQGQSPNETITIPPYDSMNGTSKAHLFLPGQFEDKCGLGGQTWSVENDSPEPRAGQVKLSTATAQSINTAFAELVSKIGSCNVLNTMKKFGMETGAGNPISPNPSSIVLGTSTVTPLTLTNAYATIAAGGIYCPPRPVVSVTDGSGKTLALTGTACKRIISQKIAAETTEIFTHVLTDPSGTAAGNTLANGRPAAGKTGTESEAYNVWFVGYTPQLATGVWVGHQSGSIPLQNITLAGTFYNGYIFGGTLAAPIWKAIMDDALEGQPIKQFQLPDGTTPTAAPNTPTTTTTVPTPTQTVQPPEQDPSPTTTRKRHRSPDPTKTVNPTPNPTRTNAPGDD